jgi:hypothetical protein
MIEVAVHGGGKIVIGENPVLRSIIIAGKSIQRILFFLYAEPEGLVEQVSVRIIRLVDGTG